MRCTVLWTVLILGLEMDTVTRSVIVKNVSLIREIVNSVVSTVLAGLLEMGGVIGSALMKDVDGMLETASSALKIADFLG
jgi:hypothetical protein